MLHAARVIALSGVVSISAAACYQPGPEAIAKTRTANTSANATCPAPATGPHARWRHRAGASATANLLGAAHHAASDSVLSPGGDALIRAKFAYGIVSKDLEDENVSLWLQMSPCGAWNRLETRRTNHHGKVRFSIPAHVIPAVGAYQFQVIADGDLSRAYGTIYVLPTATQAAVFDIDGTLTTSDMEIVKQVAFGSDPKMRPGAATIVQLYANAGYLPVYITGRPYMLRGSSREWLRRHEFPRGIVITTERVGDSRPDASHVGRFKLAMLRSLRRAGLDLLVAYGNAETDICAYAEAGIDPAATYIIGKNGGKACGDAAASQPIDDYRQHARALAALPPARRQ